MKKYIYSTVCCIGALYFILVVIPDMHRFYFRQFVKEECLK